MKLATPETLSPRSSAGGILLLHGSCRTRFNSFLAWGRGGGKLHSYVIKSQKALLSRVYPTGGGAWVQGLLMHSFSRRIAH